MSRTSFRAIVLSSFLAFPVWAASAQEKPCGDTLAASDVTAARALMASKGFTLVSAEPLPETLSTTLVGLAVSGRPQSGCLSVHARDALSPAPRAWLGQAGGVLVYDPAKTGINLLIETSRITIARKFYFEKRDGATLPFAGDPIIVRQKQAADAETSAVEARGDVGARF